jgi:hypothetical protein
MARYQEPDGPMGDPHPDSEKIYLILEEAGVDCDVIDKVCGIFDTLAAQLNQECPRCLEQWAREQSAEDHGYDSRQ